MTFCQEVNNLGMGGCAGTMSGSPSRSGQSPGLGPGLEVTGQSEPNLRLPIPVMESYRLWNLALLKNFRF